MTVMLRSLGIPARYINGFLTGEYNDVGGDYIVRASDAHSWVEAYFPGFGWLTFDPTPPSDEKTHRAFSRRSRHYWDWFELQWSEWVINYDFLHQIHRWRKICSASRATGPSGCGTAFTNVRRSATDRLERWQDRIVAQPGCCRWPSCFLRRCVFGSCSSAPEVRQRLMAAVAHCASSPPAR